MSIDLITEILAAHAEQLNSGQSVETETFLAPFPDKRAELEPLLDVAERIKKTLKPVKPTPAFRERLHNGLMLAAHHQQAQRILIDKKEEPQWRWLLGAAAIGSAAGLIAMVWRARSQERKPIAASVSDLAPVRETA